MKTNRLNDILRDCDQFQQNASEAHEIIQAVAMHYGISMSKITSTTRKREVVEVRQIAQYILYERYNSKPLKTHIIKFSLVVIGCYFDQDHANVLHAIRTVKNLFATDKKYKKLVETLFYELIPEYNEEI